MTPSRKEHLYNQYVLSIVNDGDWYRATNQKIKECKGQGFIALTWGYLDRIRRELGEPELNTEARAYIYLGVWEYHGGKGTDLLVSLDAGSVVAKPLQQILIDRGSKHPAPTAPSQQPASQPEPSQEEPAVNNTNATIAFETKHYVYGMDVANMSAGQLIEAIKKIEAEIADLKLVKSKSEHIKKRIAELEDMLAKVVQVLDSK